jgi:hypothetical protein
MHTFDVAVRSFQMYVEIGGKYNYLNGTLLVSVLCSRADWAEAKKYRMTKTPQNIDFSKGHFPSTSSDNSGGKPVLDDDYNNRLALYMTCLSPEGASCWPTSS